MGAKPFLYAAIPGRSPRAAWVQWAETKRPYSTGGDLPDGAHEVLADLISNGPASEEELKDHLQRSNIADRLKALLKYRFIVRAKSDADLAAAIDIALGDTKGAERLDNYQSIREPLNIEDWALREYLNETVSLPRGWRGDQ